MWGTSVTGVDGHSIRTARETFTSRWIIGADGGQSIVRRWTGLGEISREANRFGFRRHYKIAPWAEYVEIHWGNRCQVYITPTAPDEICLVLMSRDSHLRIDDALPQFPALQQRLAGLTPAGTERGSFAATRRLKRVAEGHVALIGDASGTVDAITGEGLCMAFQQALALADALEAEDLGLYRRAHLSLARRPLFMADFMLLMDRSRLLQRRVLRAFSERPELFARLLATHVGKFNIPQFAATAAALGWEILTA